MKLTPLEIRKMDFTKSLRGYNAEEVRAFLETIADQVEVLQREANEFSDKVVRLETRLADFQLMEKTLQETLMKAEESAQRARVDSQREADLTLREAQVEANRLISAAHNQVERLKSEILMLQSRRDSFIKKLKYLLQSQTDLIEVLDKNDFEEEAGITGSIHEDHPSTTG